MLECLSAVHNPEEKERYQHMCLQPAFPSLMERADGWPTRSFRVRKGRLPLPSAACTSSKRSAAPSTVRFRAQGDRLPLALPAIAVVPASAARLSVALLCSPSRPSHKRSRTCGMRKPGWRPQAQKAFLFAVLLSWPLSNDAAFQAPARGLPFSILATKANFRMGQLSLSSLPPPRRATTGL